MIEVVDEQPRFGVFGSEDVYALLIFRFAVLGFFAPEQIVGEFCPQNCCAQGVAVGVVVVILEEIYTPFQG